MGRWWILLASVGLGLWIATSADVEVPAWYLGLGYGALSGLGLVGGVLVRRRFPWTSNRGQTP